MKRILIFIGLKIGELLLLACGVGVLLGIGSLALLTRLQSPSLVGVTIHFNDLSGYIWTAVEGFMTLITAALIVAFVIGITMGIIVLVKVNWKKAGRLAKK